MICFHWLFHSLWWLKLYLISWLMFFLFPNWNASDIQTPKIRYIMISIIPYYKKNVNTLSDNLNTLVSYCYLLHKKQLSALFLNLLCTAYFIHYDIVLFIISYFAVSVNRNISYSKYITSTLVLSSSWTILSVLSFPITSRLVHEIWRCNSYIST
jgi:hypothetical protein